MLEKAISIIRYNLSVNRSHESEPFRHLWGVLKSGIGVVPHGWLPMASKRKIARNGRPRGKPSLPKTVVATTAVVVSDRKKATEWYTRILGLDIVESMDHWVVVGRRGKGGMLHLCALSEFDPKAGLEPGNSGITLRVPGPDFVAACGRLKENGVEFTEGPKKEPWGWYATVRDPDGNEIFLVPA